jgi:hypothetical protein
MTTKAVVEFDPRSFGLRVAIQRQHPDGVRETLSWKPVAVVTTTGPTEPLDEAWLQLPEDDLRALYEALADHFGHSGHDVRALRRDYDAERGRVDKLIENLVRHA